MKIFPVYDKIHENCEILMLFELMCASPVTLLALKMCELAVVEAVVEVP